MGIGTLYQYFPDKDSVVRALLERERRRAQEAVGRALAEHRSAPLETAIREVLRASVEAALVTADVHEVLHHEAAARVGDARGGAGGRRLIEREIAEFLERRKAELSVRDVETAAFAIVQSTNALVHEVLSTPRPELVPSLVEEGTRLVLGYLLAKGRGT